MRRTYRNTSPYWITVRYAGSCSTCQADVAPGAKALYFPKEKALECQQCGRKTAALMYEEDTGSPYAC